MAFEERVQILSEAEQDELYGPPAFTSADQRFFFSLNDKELAIAKSLRHRGQRYMLVVLLGYFKAKPVVLNPGCIFSWWVSQASSYQRCKIRRPYSKIAVKMAQRIKKRISV